MFNLFFVYFLFFSSSFRFVFLFQYMCTWCGWCSLCLSHTHVYHFCVWRDNDDDNDDDQIEIFWYVGNNRRTAFLGTVWVTNASSIVIVANTFATSISVSAVFMARIANVVIDNRSISYANQCNCWTLISIWFSGKWRRWVFDLRCFCLFISFSFQIFFKLFDTLIPSIWMSQPTSLD